MRKGLMAALVLAGLTALPAGAQNVRVTGGARPIEGGGPASQVPQGVRIKDMARLAGVNENSLTGYGLVVGLGGTGDTTTALASPMISGLLTHYGLTIHPPTVASAKTRNVAVVAITANLPAQARSGDTVDCKVASMGDATSLNGGVLLLSLLRGPDGQVYASAQGPLDVGAPPPKSAEKETKPAATGEVPRGATIAKDVNTPALSRPVLTWMLTHPDFATASAVATAINRELGPCARATGPGSVEVDVALAGLDPVEAVARMESLRVERSLEAVVICDTRTGTVVAGPDVRLGPAVVSQRGFTIEIGPEGSSLRSVLESLQKAGARPADVVVLLRALEQSGALPARVELR